MVVRVHVKVAVGRIELAVRPVREVAEVAVGNADVQVDEAHDLLAMSTTSSASASATRRQSASDL
jgi:hypothetical protein